MIIDLQLFKGAPNIVKTHSEVCNAYNKYNWEKDMDEINSNNMFQKTGPPTVTLGHIKNFLQVINLTVYGLDEEWRKAATKTLSDAITNELPDSKCCMHCSRY